MPQTERGRRMSEVAHANQCPRCGRLAALAKRRDRLTGATIIRCRWCYHQPDGR